MLLPLLAVPPSGVESGYVIARWVLKLLCIAAIRSGREHGRTQDYQ